MDEPDHWEGNINKSFYKSKKLDIFDFFILLKESVAVRL